VVEVRGGRRSEMATRREAPNADALRIDMPFLRPTANDPHRALGILQGSRMVITRPQPIAQHKRGDAVAVQPLGRIFALVTSGQPAVAATGTDDDSRARRLVSRRKMDSQRRFVALLSAHGTRSALGPKQFDLRPIGSTQG